jgi:hypothetical protein
MAGIVLVAAVLAGRAFWTTPSVALFRLKLALDRHDLGAVMAAVDADALADQALAAMLEEPMDGTDRIRLVLRGDGAWLPAIASARDYLRLRVEQDVQRLVEDPEEMLRVSWTEFRRSLDTLEPTGAIARFMFERDEGTRYAVHLRWSAGRWRIVAVERDGGGLLLAGTPVAAVTPPACECGLLATPALAVPPPVASPERDEHFAPADPLPPAEPVAFSPPKPRRRGPSRAFARQLSSGSWAVQVSSTTDPVEAEIERDWFEERGQSAFVMSADVRGTRWQRVLVGRYATRAEAEASVARLRDLEVGVP